MIQWDEPVPRAFLPAALVPIPAGPQVGAKIGGSWAQLSLFVFFCFCLNIGAIWAFLEPLGPMSGLSDHTVGLIAAVTLAVQVAGASCAALVERRLDYRAVIVLATAGGPIAAGHLSTAPPAASLFWFAASITGVV